MHLDVEIALMVSIAYLFKFSFEFNSFLCLSCSYFTVVQKAVNVPMITAHMDTMTAAALLTDSVTTTQIITVIAPCLLLLAQGPVLLGEALRHQMHILTLELETPLLFLILRDVICIEMTEGDVLIELTITVGAAHLIPHSRGTLHHNGPQDKHPKLLIPLKELHCLPDEAQDLVPIADLQALILSVAPAAQAAAGGTFNTTLHSCVKTFCQQIMFW